MSPGAPRAQECPARPVTLIVPFAAGGTIDIGLRALAAATEKHLGQSIVGENRTGAGGLLGPAQMATSSKPDGIVTVTRAGLVRTGRIAFAYE